MTIKYMLFSYPNCAECDRLKQCLKETDIDGEEYNLILKESKLKIREFIKVIKRDIKGVIIIPTLVLQDGEEVVAVLNNREELEKWLKSKD